MPESPNTETGQVLPFTPEAEEVQSRNISVVDVKSNKLFTRNVYKLETAKEFLQSYSSNCQPDDFAVVLCLALNEERIMLDNSEFFEFLDEIECIKVVWRKDAKNKPPQTSELNSVCKMKS